MAKPAIGRDRWAEVRVSKRVEGSLGNLQWIIDGPELDPRQDPGEFPGMTATSDNPLGWAVSADDDSSPTEFIIIAPELAIGNDYRIIWRGGRKPTDPRKHYLYRAEFDINPTIGQISIGAGKYRQVNVVLAGRLSNEWVGEHGQWLIQQGETEIADSDEPRGWVVWTNEPVAPTSVVVSVADGADPGVDYQVIWRGQPVPASLKPLVGQIYPDGFEKYLGFFQVPIRTARSQPIRQRRRPEMDVELTGTLDGVMMEDFTIIGGHVNIPIIPNPDPPNDWRITRTDEYNKVLLHVPPNAEAEVYEISWPGEQVSETEPLEYDRYTVDLQVEEDTP